jgi:hypothetical protein
MSSSLLFWPCFFFVSPPDAEPIQGGVELPLDRRFFFIVGACLQNDFEAFELLD